MDLKELEHYSYRDARDIFTLELFEHHLRLTGGRVSAAAHVLEIDRSAFSRRLAELRGRVPELREQGKS